MTNRCSAAEKSCRQLSSLGPLYAAVAKYLRSIELQRKVRCEHCFTRLLVVGETQKNLIERTKDFPRNRVEGKQSCVGLDDFLEEDLVREEKKYY